jgi:hypothetical protein
MTITESGIHIFQSMDFLSLKLIIRLVGYPSTNSTGDIFILAVPKLRIEVNTKVLANPHNPLTKKAHKVAIIQKIIFPS